MFQNESGITSQVTDNVSELQEPSSDVQMDRTAGVKRVITEVKLSRTRHVGAGGKRYSSYSFLTSALDEGE
jgi:hypothetical protein